jgi:hypothetical protein
MTTINNLTIEQMREIVEGAPEGASHIRRGVYFKYRNPVEWHYWEENQWKFTSSDITKSVFLIDLNDLRTAIAEHELKPCIHGYDIACLICGFGNENGVRVWRKQIESDEVTDIRNHVSPSTKVIDHG